VTAGQSLSEAIQGLKPGMSEPEAKANAQTVASQAAQLRLGNRKAKADANNSGASADASANANVNPNARN